VKTVVSGGRASRRAAGLALLLAGLGLAGHAQAAEPQTLTYSILMDGSPVGQEQVRVRPQGDAVTVDVNASTRVKVLFLNFRYDHERQEVWRGGRLESMQARTDDDGKPASATGNAPPLTLWRPEVLKRPTLLSVIDAQPYAVSVQALGPETVEGGEEFGLLLVDADPTDAGDSA